MSALLSKLEHDRSEAIECLKEAERQWAIAEFGLDICPEQNRDAAISELHRAISQIENAAKQYREAIEALQDAECENYCIVYQTWQYFRKGFSLT